VIVALTLRAAGGPADQPQISLPSAIR